MQSTSSHIAEIMCTLTPNQVMENQPLVRAMIDAGMHSVRINTAHLSSVEQLDTIASAIKELSPEIRILIDTKGPELRTTRLQSGVSIVLNTGADVCIEGTNDDLPTTERHIYVNYPFIHRQILSGHQLLIDDGRLALDVVHVDGNQIHAKVTRGGELGSRKGLTVVDVDIDLPAVSDHDRMHIEYASRSPLVDEIAHSFVRSAADVMAVKSVMTAPKPLIAKIENRQGIGNLHEIIPLADAILIARGDLSANIGKENIPEAQRLIAERAKREGKKLYLATNILPSMMSDITPSMQDIEGISIAMSQGVDVMLLTNETAAGPRPVESVAALYQAMHQ